MYIYADFLWTWVSEALAVESFLGEAIFLAFFPFLALAAEVGLAAGVGLSGDALDLTGLTGDALDLTGSYYFSGEGFLGDKFLDGDPFFPFLPFRGFSDDLPGDASTTSA
jgi:hypothetical protein